MLSITLRRSAATLGVVAGLLAAAAPASAQILDGPVLAKAGSSEDVKAPAQASCLVDFQPGVCYFHTVKAPANAMSAGISGKEMTDAVKAPASPTRRSSRACRTWHRFTAMERPFGSGTKPLGTAR